MRVRLEVDGDAAELAPLLLVLAGMAPLQKPSVYRRKSDGRWAAMGKRTNGRRRTYYGRSRGEVIAKLSRAIPELPSALAGVELAADPSQVTAAEEEGGGLASHAPDVSTPPIEAAAPSSPYVPPPSMRKHPCLDCGSPVSQKSLRCRDCYLPAREHARAFGDGNNIAHLAKRANLVPSPTDGRLADPSEGADGHRHHWRIEPPNGPTSMGKCWCGEEREFVNSVEDETFVTRAVTHRTVEALLEDRKGRGIPTIRTDIFPPRAKEPNA